MAIIDQKRQVFGNIAALNVLNNGFPKLPKFDSLGSVNNDNNSTDFLVDLLNTLVGYEAIKDEIVNTITYRLGQFEEAIKDGLKRELKEMVSCSINPSVPLWFQTGGSGVEIRVSKLDFFDIMKTDPTSTEGSLIYTDVFPEKNSKDFNTYLHYKIQDPGSTESWGDSTFGNEIVSAVFNEQGTNENNTITFTTEYGVTGSIFQDKKLTDFNNDFIDSLTLFGEPDSLDSATMLNMIMEELFGAITTSKKSISVNAPNVVKSKKQLLKEAEIRRVLDCIIDSEDDVIDDSFFSFDNPTLAELGREAENRSRGIVELATCGNLAVQIDKELTKEVFDEINNTTQNGQPSKSDEAAAVASGLDKIAEAQASFATVSIDVPTIKKNFFIELIRKFVRILMSLIITPKFISLFIINHQIIYGQNTSYDGAVDFMKKNKKLVKNIAKILRDILLEILLALAIKYLSIRLSQKLTGDEIEKAKNYVSIILSYLGVPPSVLAQIRRVKHVG